MTYAEIGADIGRLVEEKQKAYGDSFGKAGQIMRVLYPDGIPPEKMDDALTVVRVLDKLFRIATDRDALGESPWRDVAGYALLSVRRVEAATGEADAAKGDANVSLCAGVDGPLRVCGECDHFVDCGTARVSDPPCGEWRPTK